MGEHFASEVLNNMARMFGFKVNTNLNSANISILFGKKRRWGGYKKYAIQTTPGNVLADVKEILARNMKVFSVE